MAADKTKQKQCKICVNLPLWVPNSVESVQVCMDSDL